MAPKGSFTFPYHTSLALHTRGMQSRIRVCVHVHVWTQLTEKTSTYDLSSLSNAAPCHACKIHPYFSAACSLSARSAFQPFFFFVAKHSSGGGSISFSSVSPPLPPSSHSLSPPSPAASILPLPLLSFFLLCVCRWNGQPASFSYFLAAKWLANFLGMGSSVVRWGVG